MLAAWTIGHRVAAILAGGLLILLLALRLARRPPQQQQAERGDVTAKSAAERALCLAVIVMRGEFEMVVQAASGERPLREAVEAAHAEISDNLCEWLCGEGLWEKLTMRGKELLSKPMGAWTEPDVAGTTWRLEYLAAIAWALNIIPELPPCDIQTDQQSVISRLHLGRPPQRLLSEVRLRPLAEIRQARDAVESWCQQHGFLRSINSAGVISRYVAVKPEDTQAADVAHGRLRGLNWLCGQEVISY